MTGLSFPYLGWLIVTAFVAGFFWTLGCWVCGRIFK